MSRILICSDSPFLNTGFATVGRFIGQSLHDVGHEVFHVGFSDPRTEKSSSRWAGRTIPWPVLVNNPSAFDRFGQQSYSQHLLAANPELVIIVADMWNIDHLLINTPCPTIALLHIESEPLPMKLMNSGGNPNVPPKEIIVPQIVCHANMVVTAGPYGRGVLQKRLIEYCAIPPKKSEKEIQALLNNTSQIIFDPVDTNLFKPLTIKNLKPKLFKGLTNDDFVVGYFGRQNPRKGLPYALEAFANWENRPKNAYLYLHTALKDRAGWNVPQLILDLNIAKNVILDPTIKVGGGCSDEVLNGLYNACFPAGTPVLTVLGYTPIEQIKKGDNIISAEGNEQRVLGTNKRRYDGQLIHIKTTRNHVGIMCTPNHKFKILTRHSTEWREAKDLKPADVILTGHRVLELAVESKKQMTEYDALDLQYSLIGKKQESVIKNSGKYKECMIRRGQVPSINRDGQLYIASMVEKVSKTQNISAIVYNFEVDDDHSYIAGGMGVKNCDVTLLPSTGEGAGLTLMESSAAGTPTITTEYSESMSYMKGVCETIKPVGFWVEPNTNLRRALPDVKAITKKLKKFYKNPKYGKELGERARKRMIERFDSKIIAPRWVSLSEAMIKAKIVKHSVEKISKPEGVKTICFVGSYFMPDLIGGGEITYYKILKEFEARGWKPYCLVCRDGIRDETLVLDGIHVTRTDRNAMERKVSRYLTVLKPDVIITTLLDATLTKTALHTGRKNGAITIYYEQFYNSIVKEYRNVMDLSADKAVPWGKDILGSCDLIYSNSAFVQTAMEKHQGFSSKILHPYIDFDDVKIDESKHGKWDPQYITMINPDPGKGGLTMLYAAKKLEKYKFLTVKISARADYRALGAIASSIKNLDVWDFQKDPRKIYQKTKILIVPTVVDETFGRVILEAHRNSIPVLARDVGGIKDTMGEGGILIDKYDDDDVWCETIDKVMSDPKLYEELSKKAFDNWKKFDYKSEFDSLFNDISNVKKKPVANIQKDLCCVFPNFPGVDEVFSNLEKVFPDETAIIRITSTTTSVSDTVDRIKDCKPKTIIFGAWLPLYMNIIKQIRQTSPEVRIVIGWFSNFSQMEFSVNNELGIFGQLRRYMKGKDKIIDEIWMSSEEDGNLLNKTDKGIKPFPCPIVLRPMRKPVEKIGNKIKIGLFCTPGPRKNLANQILAASQIPNAELHVNGLSQRPEFSTLMKHLDLKVIDHGWMAKDKYIQTISEMDIGLQVTFAETFNYVVADFMNQGIPIITSYMVPIVSRDESLHEMAVKKADSPEEITQKILFIIKNNVKYSKLCYDSIVKLAERNNRMIKDLIS